MTTSTRPIPASNHPTGSPPVPEKDHPADGSHIAKHFFGEGSSVVLWNGMSAIYRELDFRKGWYGQPNGSKAGGLGPQRGQDTLSDPKASLRSGKSR